MLNGTFNSSHQNQSQIYDNIKLNQSKKFDLNETKGNFRSTTRNFSVNGPRYNVKPENPSKIIFKDPDIWDPP
jgi:hypothetical protein